MEIHGHKRAQGLSQTACPSFWLNRTYFFRCVGVTVNKLSAQMTPTSALFATSMGKALAFFVHYSARHPFCVNSDLWQSVDHKFR